MALRGRYATVSEPVFLTATPATKRASAPSTAFARECFEENREKERVGYPAPTEPYLAWVQRDMNNQDFTDPAVMEAVMDAVKICAGSVPTLSTSRMPWTKLDDALLQGSDYQIPDLYERCAQAAHGSAKMELPNCGQHEPQLKRTTTSRSRGPPWASAEESRAVEQLKLATRLVRDFASEVELMQRAASREQDSYRHISSSLAFQSQTKTQCDKSRAQDDVNECLSGRM